MKTLATVVFTFILWASVPAFAAGHMHEEHTQEKHAEHEKGHEHVTDEHADHHDEDKHASDEHADADHHDEKGHQAH